MGVAKLFAHIGLKVIDDLAGERHGQGYVDYKAHAVSWPESETQVQMLLTRLARYLPSTISQHALRIVDDLLVAAVAGCAGEASPTNLTAATQGRALLAMRYGGVLPGAATTAPAQQISSVAAVERSISETGAAQSEGRSTKCASAGAGAPSGTGSKRRTRSAHAARE